jgi:hypothetical protein
MRLEVLAMENVEAKFFWHVAPCSLAGRYECIVHKCRFLLQGEIEKEERGDDKEINYNIH